MNYCSECKTHATRGHKLDCSRRWSNQPGNYNNITTEMTWTHSPGSQDSSSGSESQQQSQDFCGPEGDC